MCAASVLGLQFFLVVWSLFSFFTYVFCFICIAFVFVVLFCYCLIFAFLLVFGAFSAWLSVLLASVRLLISQNVVPSHGIRFAISRHHHRQAQAALWHLRAPSSFGGMVASLWFWELAPRLRLLSAPCNRCLQARLALPSLPGLARSHLEQVACLGLDKLPSRGGSWQEAFGVDSLQVLWIMLLSLTLCSRGSFGSGLESLRRATPLIAHGGGVRFDGRWRSFRSWLDISLSFFSLGAREHFPLFRRYFSRIWRVFSLPMGQF